MQIINGSIFDLEQGFVSRSLYIKDTLITDSSSNGDVILDATNCYVIPGLIDIHFHGCCGQDFSDATSDGLQAMADYELKHGITYICPAGVTVPEEQLFNICKNAATHCKISSSGAELVGINLEGPFLSESKKGAQNAAFLRKPDFELARRLQDTSDNLIKLITVAPEEPGALEFIKNMKDINISLGHTATDYDTAVAAFEAGAGHVTHLYNGMNPLHHRLPGLIGAAFDTPDTKVELISDGIHIHPAVVRATFQLFGKERVVLISDTLCAAGMPDGKYSLGGLDVIVRGNRATLAEAPDTLAGSATNLMDCMKTAVSFGIPLADAVRAATFNPAQAIGLEHRIGSLDVGKDATAILLNKEDLSIKKIIFKGTILNEKKWS